MNFVLHELGLSPQLDFGILRACILGSFFTGAPVGWFSPVLLFEFLDFCRESSSHFYRMAWSVAERSKAVELYFRTGSARSAASLPQGDRSAQSTRKTGNPALGGSFSQLWKRCHRTTKTKAAVDSDSPSSSTGAPSLAPRPIAVCKEAGCQNWPEGYNGEENSARKPAVVAIQAAADTKTAPRGQGKAHCLLHMGAASTESASSLWGSSLHVRRGPFLPGRRGE